MSEPKLFNKDNEFDIKAREIFQVVSKPVVEDSKKMAINCEDCYLFADILINNGLILFANVIPQDVYRKILNKVLAQFNYVGTYSAYYTLLKLFYGQSCEISFTTLAPAHLLINVSNIQFEKFNWINSDNSTLVDEEENHIIFANKVLDLTEENLKNLIDNIKPMGYIIDIYIE